MADKVPDKASAHEAPKAETPKAVPKASLTPAAEATNPAVHDLLAERFSYEQHVTGVDDAVAAMQEQKKAALEKLAEVDDKLAELGYASK